MDQACHNTRRTTDKLSWEETYRAKAAESEDWSDFDIAIADGLDLTIPQLPQFAPETSVPT